MERREGRHPPPLETRYMGSGQQATLTHCPPWLCSPGPLVGKQADRLFTVLPRGTHGLPHGHAAPPLPRQLLGVNRRGLLSAETGTYCPDITGPRECKGSSLSHQARRLAPRACCLSVHIHGKDGSWLRLGWAGETRGFDNPADPARCSLPARGDGWSLSRAAARV